jgi:1A family penicillin-binding protein
MFSEFKHILKNLISVFSIEKVDLLIGLLAVGAFLSFVPVFTYVAFAQDLDNKESIVNRNDTGIILLDKKDRPFFTFYSGHLRTFTSLDQIPPQTRNAIIAAEDKDFYEHPGFSPKSIIGAVIADIKHQDLAFGGSTITQQLVKISLLNSSKSFLRKYQELVLAQEIERRYSKDEVLEMYLNSVYFGEGAIGIQDASETYFNKNAQELSLAEASMLAGIINAPSRLSPYTNYSQAKQRQHYVLDNMLEKSFITPEQANNAFNEGLTFQEKKNDLISQAPHFAFMAKDELINKYGEETIARSGFVVKTTIDLDYQAYAEKVVADQVSNLAKNKVTNGAAIVLDPKTGEIRSLVGSKDWNEPNFGKLNIITSLIQPGSSFKPLVYADALEKKVITPSTLLQDVPVTYKGNVLASKAPKGDGSAEYKPLNYDKKFRGPVTVRRALSNSLNIPSVEIISKIGVEEAINKSTQLGITTLGDVSNYGLSLVLGAGEVRPLDLTTAYGVFANQGVKFQPTTIISIKDKYGKTIYTHEPKGEKVLDEGVAYQIYSILSDPNDRREVFGNSLDNRVNAAVKTGTTNDYRDAWTMGFTDSVVVGVWVGNNDNSPMDQIAGSLGAAPIFRALIEKFSEGPAKFDMPNNLDKVSVCRYNGLLTREATSSALIEYFLPGTKPTTYCNFAPQPSTPPQQPTNSSPAPSNQPSPPPPPKSEDKDKEKNNQKSDNTQTIEIPNGGTVTIQNSTQNTSSSN